MPYPTEQVFDNPITLNVKALATTLGGQYRGPFQKFISSEWDHSEHISINRGAAYPIIVLGFDQKEGEGFKKFYSELPPKELAFLLLKAPVNTRALLHTTLQLPELTEEEKRQHKEQQQRLQVQKEILEKAKALPIISNERRIKRSEKYISVSQHEYASTTADSDSPILVTEGIDSCIGLALYNPQTKQSTLAHIDALTSYDSIEALLKPEAGLEEGQALHVHLVGGDSLTATDIHHILKLIDQAPHLKLKSTHIFPTNNISLAIDARTGKVFLPKLPPSKILDSAAAAALSAPLLDFSSKTPLRKSALSR